MKRMQKDKLKPKYNMMQNTWYAVVHAAKYKPAVLVQILAMIAGSMMISLSQLYLPKTIVAGIENGVRVQTLVMASVLLAAMGGAGETINSIAANLKLNGKIDLRLKLLEKIAWKELTMSYENFNDMDCKSAMSKASRATANVGYGAEEIYRSLPDLLISLCGFIVYMCLLMSVNPLILAIIAFTAVIPYLINIRYNQWLYKSQENSSKLWKKVSMIDRQNLSVKTAKDIRLFDMREWLSDIRASYYKLYVDVTRKEAIKGILVDLAAMIMAVGREGIAYGYLINLAVKGQISASEFVLMFAAIGGFAGYVTGIFRNFQRLHKDCLGIDEVRCFLELPEKFTFESGEQVSCSPDGSYEFELKNVRYRYPDAEQDILKNFNLNIRPGEKLAVVGRNGAGKTTFIKLLAGLYDPTEGEVLLNGKNIKTFDRRSYYKLFAAVFQQFSVLPLTIGQNVAQSLREIDEDRVWNCLRMANLEDAVMKHEKGLDTLVDRSVHEDGINLSGGELQRLMLARALYKNAPVILLDEPTAALDPIAESDIYSKYQELTAGRTSIFISHRLASTRFCDRILYIEDGRIAEEGSHEELMQQKGRYYELFEIQSKYYKEGGAEDE